MNVRLIAATHRDLRQMLCEKQFRSDLYFRLNTFPISVPPLRERREDVASLARFFAEDCVRRMNRRVTTIPGYAMKVLTDYDWPGNVRELQNFIERAVILSPDTELRAPMATARRYSARPASYRKKRTSARAKEFEPEAFRVTGRRLTSDQAIACTGGWADR